MERGETRGAGDPDSSRVEERERVHRITIYSTAVAHRSVCGHRHRHAASNTNARSVHANQHTITRSVHANRHTIETSPPWHSSPNMDSWSNSLPLNS